MDATERLSDDLRTMKEALAAVVAMKVYLAASIERVTTAKVSLECLIEAERDLAMRKEDQVTAPFEQGYDGGFLLGAEKGRTTE